MIKYEYIYEKEKLENTLDLRIEFLTYKNNYISANDFNYKDLVNNNTYIFVSLLSYCRTLRKQIINM